jgi:surface antigen
MFRRFVTPLVICALVFPALGCATQNGQNGAREDHTGEQVGTIVGAIGGALLGSRVGRDRVSNLGMIAGGIMGAWAGGRLGRMFDERDRQMQKQAADDAMRAPVGKPVSWSNPESGNSGTVTPLRESVRPADGATCREFEQSVATKDGRVATERGTACRAADGTWRVAG